jgi:hypothetical protein
MSPQVTEWVRSRRGIQARASATIVADVADARIALDSDDPDAFRSCLRDILERAQALPDGGVSVADAAAVLQISQPTVRAWMQRGVLQRAGDSRPAKITESSLGEAVAAVETIRQAGSGRQLRHVLDALEDRRTRAQLEAAIAELEAGGLAEVDPDDFDDLFL